MTGSTTSGRSNTTTKESPTVGPRSNCLCLAYGTLAEWNPRLLLLGLLFILVMYSRATSLTMNLPCTIQLVPTPRPPPQSTARVEARGRCQWEKASWSHIQYSLTQRERPTILLSSTAEEPLHASPKPWTEPRALEPFASILRPPAHSKLLWGIFRCNTESLATLHSKAHAKEGREAQDYQAHPFQAKISRLIGVRPSFKVAHPEDALRHRTQATSCSWASSSVETAVLEAVENDHTDHSICLCIRQLLWH